MSVTMQSFDHSTYSPVPKPTTGQTLLNRILSLAYSTASVRVALMAAALDALYQVNPGRGRMPAVDATVTKAPPLPFFCRYGTMTLVE